jgi:hypothetical protein
MPAAMEPQVGSTVRMPSPKGTTATTIQSTAASRPTRAAVNWLTTVDHVLLIRPRTTADFQRTRAGRRSDIRVPRRSFTVRTRQALERFDTLPPPCSALEIEDPASLDDLTPASPNE